MSNFEERLLVELRNVPVHHGRRAPRLALAGAVVAALAVAAVVGVFVLSAGTQAAYAVTKNADGSVTVEIDSLTDAAGLEAKLRAAGVPAVVEYLPIGKTCKQPWFTPAAGAETGKSTSEVSDNGSSTTFTITSDQLGKGTLVITTQSGPGDQRLLSMAYAQGDVPPCQVVDAP